MKQKFGFPEPSMGSIGDDSYRFRPVAFSREHTKALPLRPSTLTHSLFKVDLAVEKYRSEQCVTLRSVLSSSHSLTPSKGPSRACFPVLAWYSAERA